MYLLSFGMVLGSEKFNMRKCPYCLEDSIRIVHLREDDGDEDSEEFEESEYGIPYYYCPFCVYKEKW
jgi:hypothetical protein